jgi:nicotinate-nucleotide--dimethylbenzimidazole phosphoribosyltransferase
LPDEKAREAARARQESLTKPPGSLGRLEELSLQLAAITGEARPAFARKAVIVMAADHGVAEEGVSAYPAEVTRQMVQNFLRGGAAINVLAGQAGARVVVVNAGLREASDPGGSLQTGGEPREAPARFVDAPVARGTASMVRGPAMSAEEAVRAIELGRRILREEVERGLDLVATGEMGIGNTTASAALVSALTGEPPRRVTGRGTGIDEAGLERKISAIERALSVNRPDPADPLDVLRKVGGLEIAGLVGVILEAAARRIPVVLDGFISGAAALVAAGLAPGIKPFLIAAHLSVEIGHRVILERLGLRPLLDLDLRLGEGTGAALAMPLVEAAARILGRMATFGEAGVSEKS